ncbi:MAG: AMP-binding protein [Acidobacteriaceae bacterium]
MPHPERPYREGWETTPAAHHIGRVDLTSWDTEAVRPHLATLLDDLRRHGDQRAIVTHAGNRRYTSTWGELAVFSARFAAELNRRGIGEGDRVLLWGRNTAEWIAAFFGCVLRGVLVVPLDAAGSPGFAERVIRETSPKLLVGTAALLDSLPDPAESSIPRHAFESFVVSLPPPDFTPASGLNRATTLQIIFTSGTTAEPKGIVHTHGNVLASLDPIEREMARYLKYERIFHPLRFLHTLPLSHVFGQFMGLWVPPLLAAELHFEARLEAPRLIRLIKQERISVLAAVPRVLELLRSHLLHAQPELGSKLAAAEKATALQRWWLFRRQHRLFGFKFWAFVCGGATLPEDLERFWTGLGFALIQGYGMTETTALVTLNHPFRSARGTIGKPLAGREVKIAPDAEILVRGESIAGAEWRNGALQHRQAEGGWLATGDLAAQNADDALVFTGRKSDVIVTAAGLNIHPQDLEAALLRHSGVHAAVVVPYASAAGPQPVAVLILNPKDDGDEGGDASAAVETANRSLADYQQIRRWLLWPQAELPRTTTGKVLRRQLVTWVAQSITAGTPAQPVGNDPLLAAIGSLPGITIPEHPSGDTRLSEDLHLDSLGLVELQSLLESTFGVELDDPQWQNVRTLGDIRRLLQLPASGPAQPAGATPSAQAAPSPAPSSGPATLHPAVSHPAGSRTAESDYPRWPWSLPIRLLRVAFLEAVARPLIRLLLAPRIDRQASAADLRQPMLIVANHVTAFDAPLVLYALPRPVRRRVAIAMAAHILLGWRHARAERHRLLRLLTPFAYWLLTALFNIFPLPQGAGLRRSFAHAGEALDRGMHVLIFPEGRRAPDDTLGAFQSGIGLLARESGVPVLPVYLEGLGAIKAQRGRWFRPGTVTLHVGSPLTMTSEESPQLFTKRLRTAVASLATHPDVPS